MASVMQSIRAGMEDGLSRCRGGRVRHRKGSPHGYAFRRPGSRRPSGAGFVFRPSGPTARAVGNGSGAVPRLGLQPLRGADGGGAWRMGCPGVGVVGFDTGRDHLTGMPSGAQVLAAPPGLVVFFGPADPRLAPWATVLAPFRGLVCSPSGARMVGGHGGWVVPVSGWSGSTPEGITSRVCLPAPRFSTPLRGWFRFSAQRTHGSRRGQRFCRRSAAWTGRRFRTGLALSVAAATSANRPASHEATS